MPHAAITKSIEVYNLRDENDQLRDLEPHEEAFLEEVARIGRWLATTCGEAIKQFGDGSIAYDALVNLAKRQANADYSRALEAYEAAEYPDEEALVAPVFAEAAE